MKVLFVCTGNSCRSVIAHYLLEKMARDRGLGWKARSCGVAARPDFPVPAEVGRALAQRGVQDLRHVPRPVSRADLAWADLVLAMAAAHRDFLLSRFPEHRGKIALFLERTLGLAGADVDDPIGRPDPVYAACRDTIEKGLAALLESHAAEKN